MTVNEALEQMQKAQAEGYGEWDLWFVAPGPGPKLDRSYLVIVDRLDMHRPLKHREASNAKG